MQAKSPKDYNWSEFTFRMRNPENPRTFRSLRAWSQAYGFAYKTVWALVHGTYVDGAGPKIQAIIDQALKDGFIDELQQAA